MATRNAYQPVEARFWPKVRKGDGCWEWTGMRDPDGYGKLRLSGPRTDNRCLRAHRVSWELRHGAIPPDMQVCHSCDNPPCVNPAHLFLGSSVENQMDKVRKGRHARGTRHGNALFTVAQVAELRRRFAAGPTNDCHLGLEYGVSPSAIRFLRLGRTWRSTP